MIHKESKKREMIVHRLHAPKGLRSPQTEAQIVSGRPEFIQETVCDMPIKLLQY